MQEENNNQNNNQSTQNVVPSNRALVEDKVSSINENVNPISNVNTFKSDVKKKEIVYTQEKTILTIPPTESELLGEFVGKQFFDISTKRFNFFAFLFTSLYCFYRKMPILGLITSIIEIGIFNFTKYSYLIIIVHIILGFTFNNLYLRTGLYRIKELRRVTKGDALDLRHACNKKGGVNSNSLIFGFLFNLILIVLLVYLGLGSNTLSLLNKIGIKITLPDSVAEKLNINEADPEFNGIIVVDSSVRIDDEIKYEIPNKFVKDVISNDYKFSYQYVNTKPILNSCKFELSVVKKYSSADTLLMAISKYENNNNINDFLDWKYVSAQKKTGKEYYYVKEINNKIYLAYFVMQNNAPDDCLNSIVEIVNSIHDINEEVSEEETSEGIDTSIVTE